jgi:hypothetical protein
MRWEPVEHLEMYRGVMGGQVTQIGGQEPTENRQKPHLVPETVSVDFLSVQGGLIRGCVGSLWSI